MRFLLLAAALLAVLLCGCWSTSREHHEVMRARGQVAGEPVDLTITRDGTQQSQTVIDMPSMPAGDLLGLIGGGAGGAGIVGLAAAYFMRRRRNASDRPDRNHA